MKKCASLTGQNEYCPNDAEVVVEQKVDDGWPDGLPSWSARHCRYHALRSMQRHWDEAVNGNGIVIRPLP